MRRFAHFGVVLWGSGACGIGVLDTHTHCSGKLESIQEKFHDESGLAIQHIPNDGDKMRGSCSSSVISASFKPFAIHVSV